MSLLGRSLIAFAFGIAGASALQFADYAEALDRDGLARLTIGEPADMNLGDCVSGRIDPQWPAQYRTICADLATIALDPNAASAGTSDNDLLETGSINRQAPRALSHSTVAKVELPALGLRGLTPHTSLAPTPPVPISPTRSKSTGTPAPRLASLSKPACTVDTRGATTLTDKGHARILPPVSAALKSSSHRQSGIALFVQPACTVQSPVGGRVMYAGDFKGYRGVVIVRMESTEQLIIAGLDRLDVARGQTIGRGTNIGATSHARAPALATAYGANEADHSLLYFDLRNAKGEGITPQWLPKAG